jgi:hypothetical protein
MKKGVFFSTLFPPFLGMDRPVVTSNKLSYFLNNFSPPQARLKVEMVPKSLNRKYDSQLATCSNLFCLKHEFAVYKVS